MCSSWMCLNSFVWLAELAGPLQGSQETDAQWVSGKRIYTHNHRQNIIKLTADLLESGPPPTSLLSFLHRRFSLELCLCSEILPSRPVTAHRGYHQVGRPTQYVAICLASIFCCQISNLQASNGTHVYMSKDFKNELTVSTCVPKTGDSFKYFRYLSWNNRTEGKTEPTNSTTVSIVYSAVIVKYTDIQGSGPSSHPNNNVRAWSLTHYLSLDPVS